MVLGSSTRLASDWSRAVAYDIAHPQLADTLAVACLAAASTPWLLSHTHHGPAVWLCDVGLLVPLVWRRRQPVVVFALLAVVAFVQWLTAEALVTDVALLAALFTVAFERPLRTAIAAGTVLEAGVILASFRWSLAGSWIRSLVALSGLAAVALLLGAILRVRRAHLAELTERAARLELERDQQAQIAAAAERTRIAREMHDVIAHSLAVMVTMADGATAKLARDPARAGTAIQAISDVGRQALGETRRLLGVLRAEDKGPDLAPQPGLAQLEELMEQLRATGLKADLVKQGRPFDLPPGAELTVYRLVQEAGTNTLKHAPTATSFRVRLDFSHPRLLLEAVDDGPRVLARNSGGAGHGIAGMRERVSLYGGTVDTGPSPDGGWVVRASLDATSGP
ncbi:MAG: integral rane sensor signal transduction histidine kinase [Acidimicrobiaceae bacterium]|nr:integral rane sensor signal transduction histidine kinase [Acidimicrobiaceae bacterium]